MSTASDSREDAMRAFLKNAGWARATLQPLPGKNAVPELAASQTEFWCPHAPRANSQVREAWTAQRMIPAILRQHSR